MARTEEIAAEFKGKIVRAISGEHAGKYYSIRIEFQDGTLLLIEGRAFDIKIFCDNEWMSGNSIYS